MTLRGLALGLSQGYSSTHGTNNSTHVLHDEPSFLIHVQRYADAFEVAIELVLEPLGSWLLLLDRLGSLQSWEETSQAQEIQNTSIRYVGTKARDGRRRHTLGWYRVSRRLSLPHVRTKSVARASRRPKHLYCCWSTLTTSIIFGRDLSP